MLTLYNNNINKIGWLDVNRMKPILKKETPIMFNESHQRSRQLSKPTFSNEFRRSSSRAIEFKNIKTSSKYDSSDENYTEFVEIEKEAITEMSQFIESFLGTSEDTFRILSRPSTNKENSSANRPTLDELAKHNPKYENLKLAKQKWTSFLTEILNDKIIVDKKLNELKEISKLSQQINKRMKDNIASRSNSVAKQHSSMEEKRQKSMNNTALNTKSIMKDKPLKLFEICASPSQMKLIKKQEILLNSKKIMKQKSITSTLNRSKSFNDIYYDDRDKRRFSKQTPTRSSDTKKPHVIDEENQDDSNCECDDCQAERELRTITRRSVTFKDEHKLDYLYKDSLEDFPIKKSKSASSKSNTIKSYTPGFEPPVHYYNYDHYY